MRWQTQVDYVDAATSKTRKLARQTHCSCHGNPGRKGPLSAHASNEAHAGTITAANMSERGNIHTIAIGDKLPERAGFSHFVPFDPPHSLNQGADRSRSLGSKEWCPSRHVVDSVRVVLQFGGPKASSPVDRERFTRLISRRECRRSRRTHTFLIYAF